MHCFGAPRDGAIAHAAPAGMAGAQRGAADAGGGPRDRRRRCRVPTCCTRTPGTPTSPAARRAAARHPARAHRALARAAAAVEGRAARRRLPGVVLGRADRVRNADAVIAVSRGMKADILAVYPFIDPDKVHVVHNGIDTTLYAPDRSTDVLERIRRRPGPAVRDLRRPDHPAEGRRAPARRRPRLRSGGAAGALRRRAGHPGDRRGHRGAVESLRADAHRRGVDPRDAAARRTWSSCSRTRPCSSARRCTSRSASSTWRRWPARRRSSPRGRRHPRGRRRRRDRAAGAATRRRTRRGSRRRWPRRSTRSSATRSGPRRWAGPGGRGPCRSSAGTRSPAARSRSTGRCARCSARSGGPRVVGGPAGRRGRGLLCR